jgi:hypothetical protein
LVVGEHHLLDGACRLGEVFLKRKDDQYSRLKV